jgi:hypothetical protein
MKIKKSMYKGIGIMGETSPLGYKISLVIESKKLNK